MKYKKAKIFLAGHKGLVGSSVLRLLKKKNYENIFTVEKKKIDLTNQISVSKYLNKIKPDSIIICAAKVGGIKENMKKPAEFFYENSMIQNNIIHGSYLANVKNLIFLGSSCIYPKFSRQPIQESELLNGKLEFTNQSYALAKISGIEMCRSYNNQYNTNYKCLMPTNLYGPNDNYNLESSHFFAAAIRKIYEAKKKKKRTIKFWGTGNAKREAMFVDDLAEAILYFLNKKTRESLINIGSGYELRIRDYLKIISELYKYDGNIEFDGNKKIDGTPRKIVNTKLANSLGWVSKFDFYNSIKLTIRDFIENYNLYIKKK